MELQESKSSSQVSFCDFEVGKPVEFDIIDVSFIIECVPIGLNL